MGDLVRRELTGRLPSGNESAQHRHTHDDAELSRREEEEQRNVREHGLLQSHRKTDNASDHDTEQATRHDKDEGLIEIAQLNASSGEAHGSQDTDLLGLIEQVGAHTRAQ